MQVSTIVAGVVCSALGAVVPVRADVAAKPRGTQSSVAQPALPPVEAAIETEKATDSVGEAARWYALAEAQWQVGDFRNARDSMRRAYQLSGRKELLFNLAQLSRELGECQPAMTSYKAYLEAKIDARRADARRALLELEGSCAPPPVRAAVNVLQPTPTPTPAQPKYWTTPRIVGWSAVGAGAIAAAGTFYCILAAKDAEADLEDLHASAARERGVRRWDTAAEEREAEGERAETFGRVLGVATAVLVTGGALLVTLNPHRLPPERPPVALQIGPSQLRAEYSVAF